MLVKVISTDGLERLIDVDKIVQVLDCGNNIRVNLSDSSYVHVDSDIDDFLEYING